MTKTFGKGSLIKIKRIENKIHIGLGTSELPTSVLLEYDKNPPLLQAWVDLFYKVMEEFWSADDSSNLQKETSEILEPAKLVASNATTTTSTLPDPAKLSDEKTETGST